MVIVNLLVDLPIGAGVLMNALLGLLNKLLGLPNVVALGLPTKLLGLPNVVALELLYVTDAEMMSFGATGAGVVVVLWLTVVVWVISYIGPG
jgi:hypothetical protein